MSEKGFVGLERTPLFADLLFLNYYFQRVDTQRLRASPVGLPHNPFGHKMLSFSGADPGFSDWEFARAKRPENFCSPRPFYLSISHA